MADPLVGPTPSMDDALAALRHPHPVPAIPGVVAESTAATPKPVPSMDDALSAMRGGTAPREMPGGAPGAAIEGVANGAMLGGGAYAGGLIDTMLQGSSYTGNFRNNLSKNIATERSNIQGYRQAHPVATAVGELAGGALPAIAAEPLSIGRAVSGAGRLARTVGTVADGALAGGAAGAISSDPGQLAQGAKRGAILGGALGAAIPAVSGVAGLVPKTLRVLTGAGADNRALAKLAEIAAQAKVTPSDLAQAGTDAQSSQSPAILGDMMGSPGRRAVQWAVGQPSGEGAALLSKLEDRMGGQYDRVLGRMQDAVGKPFQNMPQTTDALLEQRRQAAQPLYEAAYAKGPVMTPTLEKALQDPDFAKAIAKGQSLASKRALTSDAPIAPADAAPASSSASLSKPAKMEIASQPAQPGEVVPPTGPMTDQEALYAKLLHFSGGDPDKAAAAMRKLGSTVPESVRAAQQAKQPIPIEVLDYAKRYLDNGIRRGFDAQSTFDHTTATATNGLLGKVLDEVDAQVPEYVKARAQYHSDSKMLDALDLGRQAMTMHPDELTAATSALSDPEMEMARAGFMDAFKQKAGSIADRNDLSKRFLSDPNMRSRFQSVAPNAMGALTKLRDQETGLAQTLNFAKGGSNTVDKAMFAQAMNDGVRPADLAIMPLSPHRTMIRMAGRFGQGIQLRSNAKLADELAPMLSAEPGTPAFQSVLDRLNAYGDPAALQAATTGRRSLIARALALRAGQNQP